MTTKELIRAEIERRKKEMQDKGEQKDLHDSEIIRRCVISTCDDLLSFLDTLPDEPVTDCHDLEDEIREYMSNEDNNPFDWDWRDKRDCARHFAQWGAEHLRDATKMISEDKVEL